ncbi:hypothetical protein H4R18_003040 [Coemansia javaensis]|uniref:Pentatricopeptide repeat-containing protein n=1 Tax=Coemansia javaensis TaxID=2761396 RepID=A0A9W8HA29_9FUNG|nr:hypothetical protein H4R18_003040 [Coemansia javaensis]
MSVAWQRQRARLLRIGWIEAWRIAPGGAGRRRLVHSGSGGGARAAGNPWDVVCAALDGDRARHRGAVSGAGLRRLIGCLHWQPVRPARDPVGAVLGCLGHAGGPRDDATTEPAGAPRDDAAEPAGAPRDDGAEPAGPPRTDAAEPRHAPYVHLLSEEQQTDRELAMAHIVTLEVKREAARGLHAARAAHEAQQPRRWARGADVRRTQAALARKALGAHCPALVLNLLLDWRAHVHLVAPGFYDRVCRAHLATPAQTRACAHGSRRLFDAVMAARERPGPTCRGTATGLVDALWDADNLGAGVAILAKHVGRAAPQRARPQAVDRMIASLALRLMAEASAFGQAPLAHRIFAMCRAWLRRSAPAYTILARPAALAGDMRAVAGLLRRMRANRALPDAQLWTTVLSGLCWTGQTANAKMLFSLHTLFLPRRRGLPLPAGASGPPTASSSSSGPSSSSTSNLWDQWYSDTSRTHTIDPFIWSWMQELARAYHSQRRARAHGSHVAAAAAVPPWLPTAATHYIMLKHLGQIGQTAQVVQYMLLLRRVWGRYRRWAVPRGRHSGLVGGDGMQRLQRLVFGHIAQDADAARAVFGLGRPPPASVAAMRNERYYAHCGELLGLARAGPGAPPAGPDAPAAAALPPRVVYGKAMHGYALDCDIVSMLHHMRRIPSLNDAVVWTDVLRCIALQIQLRPGDRLMLRPHLYGREDAEDAEDDGRTWLDFVFELAEALAQRDVRLTHVSFGIVVQLAAHLHDVRSVMRTAEFMRARFGMRLNAEMLMMLLRMDRLPFSAKCALVQSMLAGCAAPGPTRPADSVVRPRRAVLNLLAASAESPDDLLALQAIADRFQDILGPGAQLACRPRP